MAEDSKLAEKLEDKQSGVKFSDKEMTKLVKIRDDYLEVQNQFGQIAIMKLRLEERITDLNSRVEIIKEDYRNNQKKEQEFLEEINEKYGDGELDPETGIFHPTKS